MRYVTRQPGILSAHLTQPPQTAVTHPKCDTSRPGCRAGPADSCTQLCLSRGGTGVPAVLGSLGSGSGWEAACQCCPRTVLAEAQGPHTFPGQHRRQENTRVFTSWPLCVAATPWRDAHGPQPEGHTHTAAPSTQHLLLPALASCPSSTIPGPPPPPHLHIQNKGNLFNKLDVPGWHRLRWAGLPRARSHSWMEGGTAVTTPLLAGGPAHP